jgi:hypothetical protein
MAEKKEPPKDKESKETKEKDKDDRTTSSSRLFKAKKFLASKTAGSKAGRKAVEHFLGDAGSQLINCLEAVAARNSSPQQAKEMIETILKLAFKGKLLHDEQLLLPEERDGFVEPVNTLAILVFRKLQYCQGLRQEDPAEVTAINLRFAQLEELVVGFLKKHVKATTCDKASGVFQYFGGNKFLEYFLYSDACRKDRQTFYKCLLVVMKFVLPEEDLSPPVVPCKKQGCAAPSCHPDGGDFLGSSFCVKHHPEFFAQFSKPSILHCLQGRKFEPFNAWAAKALPTNSINFILSVTNYANAKKTALVIFAEELYKKYVAANSRYCVPLSPGTVTEIEARLKAPAADLERHRVIFNDAKMEVVAYLDPVFLSEFVPTPSWEKFLASNRLPADYEQ